MADLRCDLTYAVRMLFKGKGMTAVVVLTLALGIGANTAIFSIVTGVLTRALPYEDSEQLVYLSENSAQMPLISVNPMNYEDWREQNQVFSEMAIYRGGTLNFVGDGEPERLEALQASSELFAVLGVTPVLGRAFLPEDDQPGAGRVTLLSSGFWERRFGSDPEIVGRAITLDGESFTVVGVLPRSLEGEWLKWYMTGDLWVPLGLYRDELPRGRGGGPGTLVAARMKRGIDVERARADMDMIAARLAQEYPDTNEGKGINVVSFQEEEIGAIRPALLTVMAAIGFVLLIACANVANLQLTRAAGRRKEIAIRSALGAGRSTLIRQLLIESTVLALFGGILGTLSAVWGVRLMAAALPSWAIRPEVLVLDARALWFALAVSLLTGVLFGLAPALQASRADLREVMGESGRSSASRGRLHLGNLLASGEVAVALVLLIGATLMIKSFLALRSVDPGFRPEGVVTMQIGLPPGKYEEDFRWQSFYRNLVNRVGGLAGVEAAGISTLLPLAGPSNEAIVVAEGEPLPKSIDEVRNVLWEMVSADYFRAMGIELIRGRGINNRDAADTPRVAVIDETMAEALWPGEDPIGKRLAFEFERHDLRDPGPIYREVVGVVRHVRHYRLDENSRVEAYGPYTQVNLGDSGGMMRMSLVARTAGDPLDLVGPMRSEILALDPEQPVDSIRTMSAIVADHWARSQMVSRLLGAFAAVALLLSAIGLYGVIAYSVSQRTREFGIRMALGAGRRQVLKMVVCQGLKLVLAGVAIGAASSLGLTRLLSSMLYGVVPHDPAVFIGISLFLVGVALVATLLPAHRATRVDPMVALRYE
jgi:putative ABC transport system permease protein